MEVKNVESIRSILLREVDEIVKKFNEKYGSEYSFELYDLSIHGDVRIEIGFVRKFYEISEVVGEQVNQSDCNPDTDECEKLFEELYSELLNDINSEYAIDISGKIRIYDVSIEFSKMECDGDYCDVGLLMELKIPLNGVEYTKYVVEKSLSLMLTLIQF